MMECVRKDSNGNECRDDERCCKTCIRCARHCKCHDRPTLHAPGFVYVIKSGDTDRYKIGSSFKNPRHRMAELQTGSADELSLFLVSRGSPLAEAYLHGVFADKHIRGEWFRLDKADLEFIARGADDDR